METAQGTAGDAGPTVVVGVDGSACSYEALSFAVGEAQLRKARLRIVTAWHVPAIAYSGGYMGAVLDPGPFEADAKATSAKAVAQAHAIAGDLEIDVRTPNETAAKAVLDASRDAQLLVVGSRGHGGFTSLLLGSVSQQLAQHAPCPVTIIHAGG